MINLTDNLEAELLGSPFTLNGTFRVVGGVVNVGDIGALSMWIDMTINDSLEPQIKVFALFDETGNEYELPIQDVSSSAVAISPLVFNLTASDQQIVVPLEIDKSIPFIKIYAKVGTVGATAADINSLKLVKSSK